MEDLTRCLLLDLIDQTYSRKARYGSNLRGSVRGFEKPPCSRDNRVLLVQGVASHDLDHAGQIQLLKR